MLQEIIMSVVIDYEKQIKRAQVPDSSYCLAKKKKRETTIILGQLPFKILCLASKLPPQIKHGTIIYPIMTCQRSAYNCF